LNSDRKGDYDLKLRRRSAPVSVSPPLAAPIGVVSTSATQAPPVEPPPRVETDPYDFSNDLPRPRSVFAPKKNHSSHFATIISLCLAAVVLVIVLANLPSEHPAGPSKMPAPMARSAEAPSVMPARAQPETRPVAPPIRRLDRASLVEVVKQVEQ